MYYISKKIQVLLLIANNTIYFQENKIRFFKDGYYSKLLYTMFNPINNLSFIVVLFSYNISFHNLSFIVVLSSYSNFTSTQSSMIKLLFSNPNSC